MEQNIAETSIVSRSVYEIQKFLDDPSSYTLEDAWAVYASQPTLRFNPARENIYEYGLYEELRSPLKKSLLGVFGKSILVSDYDDEAPINVNAFTIYNNALSSGIDSPELHLKYAEILEEYNWELISAKIKELGLVPHGQNSKSLIINEAMFEEFDEETRMLYAMSCRVPNEIRGIVSNIWVLDLKQKLGSGDRLDETSQDKLNFYIRFTMLKLSQVQTIRSYYENESNMVEYNRKQAATIIESVSNLVSSFGKKIPSKNLGAIHEFEWMAGMILAQRFGAMPEMYVRPARDREDFVMHGRPDKKSNTDLTLSISYSRNQQTFADATIPIQLKSSSVQSGDNYDKQIHFAYDDRKLFQVSRMKKRLEEVSRLINLDEHPPSLEMKACMLPSVLNCIESEIQPRTIRITESVLRAREAIFKSTKNGDVLVPFTDPLEVEWPKPKYIHPHFQGLILENRGAIN